MSLPLEAEKEEFRMCYNCALKDAKEDLNPEDMAVQAFQLWWAKWQAKHDALRRTQQSFSQMTLQENSRSQSAYPPREEGYFDQSMNFPNTFPFQERQEMTRNTSHPQPLQHSSIEGEFRNMVPPARQNATNSSLGHQIYGEIPMLSQALIAQSSPNVEQSSGQQTFYPSEHINPMMMGGSSMQQPNIYANPLGLPLGNQSPLSTKYDASGNSNSYPANHNPYNDINNNSTGFDVSGAPQIQQSYPAPPSQPSLYPLYATNPIQSPSVHQPQGYAPLSGATHNQTSPRQSMQPQQPLAFRKLQPDRTYPPVPPSYDDGYEE
jgi:hypothetical protein